MSDRWEMSITADAEVIPGPLRRIRELCESRRSDDGGTQPMQDINPIWPSEILAILDESEVNR